MGTPAAARPWLPDPSAGGRCRSCASGAAGPPCRSLGRPMCVDDDGLVRHGRSVSDTVRKERAASLPSKAASFFVGNEKRPPPPLRFTAPAAGCPISGHLDQGYHVLRLATGLFGAPTIRQGSCHTKCAHPDQSRHCCASVLLATLTASETEDLSPSRLSHFSRGSSAVQRRLMAVYNSTRTETPTAALDWELSASGFWSNKTANIFPLCPLL